MVIDEILGRLARAIAFLSRLPVPDRFFSVNNEGTADDSGYFPLAGAVIALPSAVLILVMSWLDAPSALTALLALLVLVLATGALHEDGLADCADAFGAGGNTERKLAILKDSRIGTYGALALLFSLALRGVTLTVLIAVGPPLATAFTFIAVAALSRALMVWHWHHLPTARADGVAGRAGIPNSQALRAALGSGLAMGILLTSFQAGLVSALVSCFIAGIAAWFWTVLVKRTLGGQTGDTIGATQQFSEITLLIALVVTL